jgi:hypothetical protein
MKFLNIITLAFFILLLPSFSSAPDCDDDDFLDNCAAEISGYKFLKAHKVSVSGSDAGKSVELSSVLSAGSTYILTACSGSNMTVTLYDRNKKLIMSNYDKAKKKYYPTIKYSCKATGVYYLKYEFENGGSGCGVGIIGFTKD